MAGREEAALEELGRGALRQEPGRAWELFDAAWPRVERRVATFLRSLGLSEEFREDCGQNTILRVWRSREEYRGECTDEFYAWLYRICRHEAIRQTEQKARRPLREGDRSEELGLEEMASSGARDDTALAIESGDEARALEECIRALDERGRALIELLHGPDKHTERQVATMLDLSKSYVNTLRQRALESLATCLQGKGHD